VSEKNDQINDEFEIHSFFRVLNQTREKFWLWQKQLENGKRLVQYGVVKKVDLLKNIIYVAPFSSKGYKFEKIEEYFFYDSVKSLAFKFKPRELSKEMMIVPIPKSIHKLTKDFLKNVELVEKEDEGKFKHLRGAPRVQPKSQQFVTLKRTLQDSEYSPAEVFDLFDISQGGMGFGVEDPSEFEIGDEIEVTCINDKEVPKPMVGEVVSIRQQEDDDNCFKVGIKFST